MEQLALRKESCLKTVIYFIFGILFSGHGLAQKYCEDIYEPWPENLSMCTWKRKIPMFAFEKLNQSSINYISNSFDMGNGETLLSFRLQDHLNLSHKKETGNAFVLVGSDGSIKKQVAYPKTKSGHFAFSTKFTAISPNQRYWVTLIQEDYYVTSNSTKYNEVIVIYDNETDIAKIVQEIPVLDENYQYVEVAIDDNGEYSLFKEKQNQLSHKFIPNLIPKITSIPTQDKKMLEVFEGSDVVATLDPSQYNCAPISIQILNAEKYRVICEHGVIDLKLHTKNPSYRIELKNIGIDCPSLEKTLLEFEKINSPLIEWKC
jgi:hypothetical protein